MNGMNRRWILVSFLSLLVVLEACRETVGRGDETRLTVDPAEGVIIDGYYGDYDTATKEPGRPAASLREPREELWTWSRDREEKAGTRLGVLFPNHEGNDPYWGAVRRGIFLQARLSGMDVELCASPGYEAVEEHREQFDALLERGVDGILLGSIHYLAMDDAVATASRREPPIPVVEVINDIHAPQIAAKALVSYVDMGSRAAEFVLEHAASTNKREISLAFLPGPIHSGWAPESLKGFLEVARAFEGDLEMLPPAWGSPEAAIQRRLTEEILEGHQRIDYLVGNAVAALEAVDLLEAMGRDHEVTVVSTYYTDGLREAIAQGKIAAAPSDRTELLGRLAVGMMTRLLDGEVPGTDFPFRAGPEVPLVTAANLETLFPPRGRDTESPESYARVGCTFRLPGGARDAP